MSRVHDIGMVLAFALISAPAFAFDEQGTAPIAPAPDAKAAPAPAEPGMNFSTPKIESNSGTEVRIPGLGKLGVLPKMDFGLELLYGANDSKQAEPELPANEDLTIRGTVKHNF